MVKMDGQRGAVIEIGVRGRYSARFFNFQCKGDSSRMALYVHSILPVIPVRYPKNTGVIPKETSAHQARRRRWVGLSVIAA